MTYEFCATATAAKAGRMMVLKRMLMGCRVEIELTERWDKERPVVMVKSGLDELGIHWSQQSSLYFPTPHLGAQPHSPFAVNKSASNQTNASIFGHAALLVLPTLLATSRTDAPVLHPHASTQSPPPSTVRLYALAASKSCRRLLFGQFPNSEQLLVRPNCNPDPGHGLHYREATDDAAARSW
jgi:hypothetical protein